MNKVERALLSCVSQDVSVIGSEVVSVFQMDNPFTDEVVWRVWNAWRAQQDTTTWNTVAIINTLEQRSNYNCDWFTEVRGIVNAEPSTANWRQHLEAVKREYTRRKAISTLEGALVEVKEADDVMESLHEASKELSNIDTSCETDEVSLISEVDAEVERIQNGERYSCGIKAIDDIVGLMEPGEVYTIAALTGVGKSLLAANIVRYLSVQNGVPGLYFSFEMNPAKHAGRIVASLTHRNSRDVLNEYINGNEEVVEMYKRVDSSPIYWDKRPRLSTPQIVNKIRRYSKKYGIKYAIVDTIDFVRLGVGKKNEQLGEFFKEFKAVCVEEGVIPIPLVQINRSANYSETGVGLHHLKDSSAIEQDSSQVLLLDRETTLTPEERQRVTEGKSLPLRAAGAKSRYDMTGFKQLALFLHSSLIQDRVIEEFE